ncbi:MAG TPA: TRAM domain-containing protein [Terrimicrobiaceae bacterium]|nr:TRAM domain-containing protein [Terrimicrobiaceae bacterium]
MVVDRVAFGGKGMGRLENGKVCFVPRVIPGERVTALVRKEKASYAEADLSAVLDASPDRMEPVCPVFGRCGGCHYQHVRYERQLVFKQEQVADVLRRIGGQGNPPVEPTVPSPQDFHYRNRITVHVKDGRVGFYAPGSRKIVEISECPIATEKVNGLLAELRGSRPGNGEYPLREPGEFRGFRQVNDAIAGRLLEVVEEMAAPGGGLLVDAYCGAGFFAKRLSAMFHMTVGIEWSADAVRAARQGVGDNEIYLLGDVKRHLIPALGAGQPETTTLLLDPPEEGLDASIIGTVLERGPSRIIYVSCNPATLARDIKRLAAGYGLRRVRPVDMFPQTAEIEAAALLEKL